jgi:nucleoside 2-deoxyribosyltransferase
MDPCPICQRTSTSYPISDRQNAFGVKCDRCGEYVFMLGSFATTFSITARLGDQHTIKALSAWVREQNDLGSRPEVDHATVERLRASPAPGLIERSRRLLLACGRLTHRYGQEIDSNLPALVAATWSNDTFDVIALGHLLRDQELLRPGGAAFNLTARGVTEIGNEQRRLVSDQVFVAMSFDPAMRQVYDEGLYVGIRNACYKPFRVDRHDHANRIDDEIMAQIRRSRFVVADFTGQKHGVYFEAGFAVGLDRPVIWSCKKDDIRNLHFDVRQYNCIDWSEIPELADRLQARIEAMLGAGPLPRPTAAR